MIDEDDFLEPCEVCVDGRYLIIDQHGRELYTITCPECCGTCEVVNQVAYEKAVEDTRMMETYGEIFPASTAARIHTKEDLRSYVEQHWSGK